MKDFSSISLSTAGKAVISCIRSSEMMEMEVFETRNIIEVIGDPKGSDKQTQSQQLNGLMRRISKSKELSLPVLKAQVGDKYLVCKMFLATLHRHVIKTQVIF
jgi:hypothetical protein